MKFLESVARGFFAEYHERISELCFVFPNRRSALFFKKYLSGMVDKPLFSPYITTFKDLILLLSETRLADRPELLFDLYETYSRLMPGGESFDEFLYWGEIILSDFNDTDKYLANPGQLFSNVKDLKQIETDYDFLSEKQLNAVKTFWEGFLPEGDSESKQSFLRTWEILYPLYKEFNRKLEEKGCSYEGALYRKVAANEQLPELMLDYREVVFVGFNALNSCERLIMKRLKNAGMADFYWDYGRDFIRERENKASLFVSENIADFPSRRDFDSTASPSGIPEVRVIGAASSVMQAKIAGELLQSLPGTEESAVVLPDETLLMPLIGSVPENISDINITMGYPLSGTPLISLVKQVAQMEWNDRGLYFKKVLPLLNHSYVQKIAGKEARDASERINRENMVYVPDSFFEESEVLGLLFSRIDYGESQQEKLCDKLLALLALLASSEKSGRIEKEFIYHIQNAITRIKGILVPMSLKSFGRVLSMITDGISIPFSGEPLAGLQIMGVLETRALDFENLIICSVNDGVFPKRNSANSFIPYNLRRGFGLPVKEHEDALYTYLFYSLISRAKNVTLLYDTRTEGLKTGEPSRFILQLKYLYDMVEKESVVNYRIEPHSQKEIVVEKDDALMDKMSRIFLEDSGSAISASALNTYIDCPLQFYFSYVEGLESPEEIDEGVEANEFGSIFHFTMEQLYNPFRGKRVTAKEIKSLLDNRALIGEYLDKGFKEFKNIDKPVGYTFLVKEMIFKYVEITLKHDKNNAPFDYLESEKRVKSRIVLDNGTVIPLKGFIDRLDRTSALRIVDYKTGKGDLRYRDIDALFDAPASSRNKVAFQMYMYALLLGSSEDVIAEPFFIRELAKGNSFSEIVTRDRLDEYEGRLKALLAELFRSKKPFTATSDKKVCEWCRYNTICY
jgi:RecB family exonuclease